MKHYYMPSVSRLGRGAYSIDSLGALPPQTSFKIQIHLLNHENYKQGFNGFEHKKHGRSLYSTITCNSFITNRIWIQQVSLALASSKMYGLSQHIIYLLDQSPTREQGKMTHLVYLDLSKRKMLLMCSEKNKYSKVSGT